MTSNRSNQAPSIFAKEIQGFTEAYRLSRRETDIILALVRNITNSEEVAKYLGISTHTVNNHLKSIFEKTKTKSKTEILASFLRFAADLMHDRRFFIRRPRVLVIDREKLALDALVAKLADRGMRAYGVEDAGEVLNAISALNIDVLVYNIDSFDDDGMEQLRSIRQTHQVWPQIILMTEKSTHRLDEFMHYGASGFVSKPVAIEQLFRMVMDPLLENGQQADRLHQVEDRQVITYKETNLIDREDLGWGGVFLAWDAANQQRRKAKLGSIVDLKIAITGTGKTFKVRGEVVWQRDTTIQNKPAGIGVKFLSMDEEDQKYIDDVVRRHNIQSFIPSIFSSDETSITA